MAKAHYKYKKRYCQDVISHMSEGKSFMTFAGVIGVAESTINKWAVDFPEFGDAKAEGFARRAAIVEDKLLSAAFNDAPCNTALLALISKNVLKLRSEPVQEEVKQDMNVNITFTEATEDDRPDE
jgi:hypothetical protein